MNIVRLTTRIYPDEGGPAVYAYNLSKFLANENYHFFNISCKPKNSDKDIFKESEYFKIYYLPLSIHSVQENIVTKISFILKFCIYSSKLILKLHKKYRIHLIHTDNPVITGIVATIFNRLFKIPFIYTQHGFDSPYKLEYLLELKIIYRFVSKYILISRRMKLFFEKNKANTEKLIWIPNGVEVDKFFHVKDKNERREIIEELNLSNFVNVDDYLILYVGYMFLKQKVIGMVDFINAFNNFIQDSNYIDKRKIKILFLGDGTFSNLLKNEINKLRLNKSIFMLSSKINIEKFYAISDLCVLTSYIEGFPTVLLEAIASHVPCLATNVGEVKEILDKPALVAPGDRHEMSSKLKRFYLDNQFRQNVLEFSLKKLKDFDWIRIADRIKYLYKNILMRKII